MIVKRAEHAGACYGVQRALDLACAAAREHGRGQTLGPLIHNPIVVSDLEHAGITVAAGVEEVDAPVAIVRSHGVTPQVQRQLKAACTTVVDATCPHVTRAQRAAESMAASGATVVVVGEKGHPEVEGLCAYAQEAGGRVLVVRDASELPDQIEEPLAVLVQTTQPRARLAEVVDALRSRGLDPAVRDTTCSATAKRQAAARQLAQTVDAMVVVGGRNSSNTTRLYEICQRECARAYHVETVADLRSCSFDGCTVVGVTAGASTPEGHISAVVECLHAWE